VGIEFREDDARVAELLAPLHHDMTATRVRAERAVVRRLDGGCDLPIAAYAEWERDTIWLRARVGAADGAQLLVAEARGVDPEQLGLGVADMLLSQGAKDLIRAVRG
jgi:hydroxymethylbilane synthase